MKWQDNSGTTNRNPRGYYWLFLAPESKLSSALEVPGPGNEIHKEIIYSHIDLQVECKTDIREILDSIPASMWRSDFCETRGETYIRLYGYNPYRKQETKQLQLCFCNSIASVTFQCQCGAIESY